MVALDDADLRALVQQQADLLAERDATIADLTDKLEALQYRIAQMERQRFGQRSEVVPGQALLDLGIDWDAEGLVPDENVADVSAADEGTADAAPDQRPTGLRGRGRRQGQRRGGRMRIPQHIERKRVVVEPPAHERVGPDGQPLTKLRENISERLEYVPGCFVAVEIVRPVYGVRGDEGPTQCADVPPQVVTGGIPADSVVALVLSEKFDLHSPLYRQEDRFARAGITVPRSTMVNWLTAAHTTLQPIVAAIEHEVRSGSVIGLDDTTVRCLRPADDGGITTARFWGYLGSGAMAVRFAADRTGTHPLTFLADWSGSVVADAYSGHEALYRDPLCPRRHVPCLAHVRRKFYEAWADGGDERARPALAIMRRLYDVEDRLAGRPPDVVVRERQRVALPLLDQFRAEITRLRSVSTPKSPLGRACTYAHNLSDRLDRYCAAGELPIDNNALERMWKPVALGRKNYLFVGSPAGGERAAAAYTITLSCRLAEVDPYHYLVDTFAALHRGGRPAAELTPRAYAARQTFSTCPEAA